MSSVQIVLKRTDGSVVEPIHDPDGSLLYVDVDTKLIFEFVGRDVRPNNYVTEIDPHARLVYIEFCVDTTTGQVKGLQKKYRYPSTNQQRKIRRSPAAWGGGPEPVVLPPSNDDCSNAIPISDGDTAFSTIDATTDGPPGTGCQFDGQTYNDIWYVYTASCTGDLTVSTCNTADYDTDLVVYDGADCGALEDPPLGCNDDGTGCAGFSSMLTVPVTNGNQYLIRIGGFNDGDMGTGTVNVSCAGATLANDDCANATLVDCNSATTVDNTTATDDPSDPEFSCRFGSPGNGVGSIWFKFVATDTSAFLDTNASAVSDTLLAVYDGTCGSLTEIGCSEDEGDGLLSEVCVNGLTVGNTYYVQVASFSASSQGSITLTVTCPCPGAASNDSCAGALDVGCNSSTLFDNSMNTTDPTDPDFSCHFGGPAQGVGTTWFTFVAEDTSAILETNNSFVSDTLLAVYSGTCGNLTEIGCSEDEGVGLLSELCVVGLNVGETYYVQVASFSASSQGMIQLDITCPCPAAPMNDDCADAIPLAVPGTADFTNEFATDDELIQCGSFSLPTKNVWFSVMGTGTTMTASTCNAFTEVSDTIINVYCGDCLEPVCVAGVDDNCDDFSFLLTEVSWCSQLGVEYLINVGNFPGAAGGRINLQVTEDGVPCDPEVNCLPLGACCLADGTCAQLNEMDCNAAGGDYQGDDTSCTSNSVADGSFEGGSPNADWAEASSNFGTPLCTPGLCGFGGGTGPRTGDWWAWFGGISAPETGSVSQSVTIPLDAETLDFYLEIPVASGNGVDFLNVSVDGNQLYQALESDGPYSGYALVQVDIQAYADGGMHTVSFDSTITGDDGGGNPALTNFFVDDVAINTVDVECRDCFTLDFETQDDWTTPLANGEAITSPPDFGNVVLVNGFGPDTYGTAIFDSNPTGPNQFASDQDLLVDQGNILILQENPTQNVPGFYDFPDDAQLGGTMTFDFIGPVELASVDLIDICPGPPIPQDVTLVLLDGSGNTRTYFVPGGWTLDEFTNGGGGVGTLSLQTLADQPGALATATASEDAGFDRHDVVRLVAHFASSGALDNLSFCQE